MEDALQFTGTYFTVSIDRYGEGGGGVGWRERESVCVCVCVCVCVKKRIKLTSYKLRMNHKMPATDWGNCNP